MMSGTLFKVTGAVTNKVYRATKGKVMGSTRGAPILLLTVTGRKTGEPHTSPVCYFEDSGGYVVAGSAGGADEEPQWFRNLRKSPTAIVEVADRRFDVHVHVTEGAERDELWSKLLTHAPFFSNYQVKTERIIPIAVLTPTEP